ncbi:MAG: AEC family transporter [Hyphomicrobiales bacterium]
MLTVLSLAFPFFAIIACGYIAARVFKLPETGLAWLSIFIVWFALPALIFLTVAAAPFEKLAEWRFVLATSAATSTSFLGVFAVSVLAWRTAVRVAAIQGTSASFGNVGYMGLPLAVAFFGPAAAVPAALVFCFDCALQFTLTPMLATLGHREGRSVPSLVWQSVRAIVTHPFIVATVLGVLASGLRISPPEAVATFLGMLAKAAGPGALFALGVTVGMRRLESFGPPLMLITVAKLVLQPLAALALLSLVPNLDPLWLHVALMMAALPTASNAYILANQYQSWIEGASGAILITTILSALTIPMLIWAIGHGLTP